jgi:uncharacterized alpha-E superfamily protein
MLSRVADNLYWMSRYLERAEHTARLIDVNLNQMLDQAPKLADRRWERLLVSLGANVPPSSEREAYSITQSLTFEATNRASIVACIAAARDNARQVREQISSEMWEQLNQFFLQIKSTAMDEIWSAGPHEFFRSVKEGAHLFQGTTDATMRHGEGWQFIQCGRFIERAGATALLLDAHFNAHFAAQQNGATALDYFDWVGLLKSCTAFEAYSKVYTAELQPDRIAEFLLLDAEFPRSVRFAADRVQSTLKEISRATGARNAIRADRLAGRLCASLDYAQVDEIMADSMHTYLENVQRQCSQIHNAIYQIYIGYEIDTAIITQAGVGNQ